MINRMTDKHIKSNLGQILEPVLESVTVSKLIKLTSLLKLAQSLKIY